MANNKKCKCVVCGKDFLGQKSTAKYCSRECQSIDYKNRSAINHIPKTLYHKTCELCGKEYDTYSKGSKFCSGNCKTKEYRLRTNTLKKIVPCDNCGKEIERYNDKRAVKNFCCCQCEKDYYRKLKPKDTCKQCGKEYIKENKNHMFCSTKCKVKYHSIHDFFQLKCCICGKEYLGKTRSHTNHYCSMDCMLKGMPTRNTKPCIKMSKHISKIYNIIPEYKVENFYVDLLIEGKFPVEVNGTYWHCDPRKYDIIKYDLQTYCIKRDFLKDSIVYEKLGFKTLYIWEIDINNNIELCVELIKYYISNNGDIPYYDSFNYHLENGVIVVNKQIIKPYREYSLEELNKITGLND